MAKMTQTEAARTLSTSVDVAMSNYYEGVGVAAANNPDMNILPMKIEELFTAIIRDFTRGDRTSYSDEATKKVQTIHTSRMNGFARRVLSHMAQDAALASKRAVRTDGRGVLAQYLIEWTMESGRKAFEDFSYTETAERLALRDR